MAVEQVPSKTHLKGPRRNGAHTGSSAISGASHIPEGMGLRTITSAAGDDAADEASLVELKEKLASNCSKSDCSPSVKVLEVSSWLPTTMSAVEVEVTVLVGPPSDRTFLGSPELLNTEATDSTLLAAKVGTNGLLVGEVGKKSCTVQEPKTTDSILPVVVKVGADGLLVGMVTNVSTSLPVGAEEAGCIGMLL